MTILEFKKLFTKNLSSNYSASESAELYGIFLEKWLGFDKFQQRLKGNDVLSEVLVAKFTEVIAILKTGKPFQQILGETDFYGLVFYINEYVLIPRPETEELLELAIEKIKCSGLKSNLKILDIGTGSGIIPIILKKNFPEAEVSTIDFSEDALKIAQRNANLHGVEINFIHADYLNKEMTAIFDVIISNPPYIGRNEEVEIEDSVKGFEPEMALFSPTENALIFYEKIAQDCKIHLAENGLLFLEINQKLGAETKELFVDVLSKAELLKDLSGNDRFVWGRRSVFECLSV